MDEDYVSPYDRQAICIDPTTLNDMERALYHVREYHAVLERNPAVRLTLANRTPAELAEIAAALLSHA